jgi:hypothetical protein
MQLHNNNYRSFFIISLFCSWVLWTALHYLNSVSDPLATIVCRSPISWGGFSIFSGCNVEKWAIWIDAAVHLGAAAVYTAVFLFFQLLLLVPLGQLTRPISTQSRLTLADFLQSFSIPSASRAATSATGLTLASSLTLDQISSFIMMCFSFVMIAHKHELWDAFPQFPFIMTIIESFFVATASISTPLHYVLVFDAFVASHIIGTTLIVEGEHLPTCDASSPISHLFTAFAA